jgi:hypothetical protein
VPERQEANLLHQRVNASCPDGIPRRLHGLRHLTASASPEAHASEDIRHCRNECITYAHTYALDGILTRDFTLRRHAPATAPRVVILRLAGGLPIRPDCDSMTHGNGLPLAFSSWGVAFD